MNNDLISRDALKKAIEELAITEEPVDYDCDVGTMTGISQYLDRPDVLDLIDSAPTVDPFFPISEEVFYKITDAEFEHSDSFWITTPSGKKIEFEKKRPQGEWIPVSERLPEDMQRVLIWFEYYRYGDFNCMYQTYGFGYVCDGKWSPFINGETGWQDYRIIAWQPLPEPFKEGGAR